MQLASVNRSMNLPVPNFSSTMTIRGQSDKQKRKHENGMFATVTKDQESVKVMQFNPCNLFKLQASCK